MIYAIDEWCHRHIPKIYKFRLGKWICDRADYRLFNKSVSPGELTFKEFRKEYP